MFAQVGVGVAAVGGDFAPQPGRAFEGGVFGGQFDFGNDERGVCAEVFVDFEGEAAVSDGVAVFFQCERAHGVHDSACVFEGDFVFVFAAGDVGNIAFRVSQARLPMMRTRMVRSFSTLR